MSDAPRRLSPLVWRIPVVVVLGVAGTVFGSVFAFGYGLGVANDDPVTIAVVGMVVSWGVPLAAASWLTKGRLRVALLALIGLFPAWMVADLLWQAITGG